MSILRDITLQVAVGKSLAIVGPSGCGKSTLLGLLAGLDTPTSGRVFWGSEDISVLDEEARTERRLRDVGFVFQSFQLLPQLTALENVMLPMDLIGDSSAEEKAIAMLKTVGLESRLQHFPATLSGGEQQRVALARAFVRVPRLLFADEPTGSLDAASGDRVMSLLLDLQSQHGATLIIVTHDDKLASACTDRLSLLAGAIA
ncbi:MAG: ABC transporter ATP-binding protein [Burkholderiaceae bacterium]|nr:ABC transporter ATP-binding protein [Burkholderiaceae bacterium]MDP4800376.1 ABC transporter ATP-binding protein [Burkholderiaceae bacterium]